MKRISFKQYKYSKFYLSPKLTDNRYLSSTIVIFLPKMFQTIHLEEPFSNTNKQREIDV